MMEWNPIGIIPGAVQERTPPRLGNVEEKRDGLPLRAILRTIPWNMISIKKEQDKGGPKNIWEKVATTLNALQLTEPCFSAFQLPWKTSRGG